MQVHVQDADGVVGRYLLGDTVYGASRAVERAHVNAVEGIAGIEFLHCLNVGAVPFSSRHAVFTHGREARLQDVVVDQEVVGIGARVSLAIFRLAGEVAAIVHRWERQASHVVVIDIPEALLIIHDVNVLVYHAIVLPGVVTLRHLCEEKSVLVDGVGIEVHMACAAVMRQTCQYTVVRLSQHAAQGLVHLALVESGLIEIADGGIVASVPNDRTISVAVVGIYGRRGNQPSRPVNETVSTFPHHVSDVVGNTHLPVQH